MLHPDERGEALLGSWPGRIARWQQSRHNTCCCAAHAICPTTEVSDIHQCDSPVQTMTAWASQSVLMLCRRTSSCAWQSMPSTTTSSAGMKHSRAWPSRLYLTVSGRTLSCSQQCLTCVFAAHWRTPPPCNTSAIGVCLRMTCLLTLCRHSVFAPAVSGPEMAEALTPDVLKLLVRLWIRCDLLSSW